MLRLTDDQRRRLLAGETIEIYKPPPGHCAVIDLVDGVITFSSVPPGKMTLKRYLIALDEDGSVHVRRTLFVEHHAESGEVRYHAQPVPLGRAPRHIQAAVDTLQTYLKITGKVAHGGK